MDELEFHQNELELGFGVHKYEDEEENGGNNKDEEDKDDGKDELEKSCSAGS